MITPLLVAWIMAASAERPSLLVLPVTVPQEASVEDRQLAASVERSLARALVRQGVLEVKRYDDVRASLGEAAMRQLEGCDEDTCLAGFADALGTDFILASRLESSPGLWTLRVSELDRKQAMVVLRRLVRARSVDALLSSVESVARDICGGGRLVADDPALAERLGTSPDGAAALKERLARHPGADPAALWTDFIVEKNRESDLLAFAEGALVLASGLVLLAMAPLVAPLWIAQGVALTRQAPASLAGTGRGDHTPPYVLPWLLPITLAVTTVACTLAIFPLVAALVLGIIDRLDVGRMRVRSQGCCRDETRIRAAAAPGWGRRVAPVLAAAGGVLSFMWPLTIAVISAVASFGLSLSGSVAWANLPEQPGLSVDKNGFYGLYGLYMAISLLTLGGMFIAGITGAVGAILLLSSEQAPVVDRE